MKVKNNRQGFTLMELLIVIALVGILAAVILASLNQARTKAKIATTQSQLQEIYKATILLHFDTGYFPSYQNFVTDICKRVYIEDEIRTDEPNAGLIENGRGWDGWNGPYIKSPFDPWGSPYIFDNTYRCAPDVVGCKGVNDSGLDSSVIVSCGPSGDNANGECDYDSDNIVLRICANYP